MDETAVAVLSRRLFVSYAREDRDAVQRLCAGLRLLRHEVWLDDRLSGGQEWWSEILRHIQGCDAFVVTVSPGLLESEACQRERLYAAELGKPLLPVFIRQVRIELLPPDLAPLQAVDYSDPSPEAAFGLAATIASLPTPCPLPVPLPEPPPTPTSYMHDLVARAHAPTLTLDEQMALVARLSAAMNRESERDAAMELLSMLRTRQDLYETTARAIELALSSAPRADSGPRATHTSPDTVPPGWYPDPSAHHKLRWFDHDWTDWVSDGGQTLQDPI